AITAWSASRLAWMSLRIASIGGLSAGGGGWEEAPPSKPGGLRGDRQAAARRPYSPPAQARGAPAAQGLRKGPGRLWPPPGAPAGRRLAAGDSEGERPQIQRVRRLRLQRTGKGTSSGGPRLPRRQSRRKALVSGQQSACGLGQLVGAERLAEQGQRPDLPRGL